MTLGWGIIGCGRIARLMAPAIQAAAGSQLVGVLSRDMARAQIFASQYGVPQAYDSLDAFLSDPEIRAVYIATTNNAGACRNGHGPARGYPLHHWPAPDRPGDGAYRHQGLSHPRMRAAPRTRLSHALVWWYGRVLGEEERRCWIGRPLN
jgi:hypothetical protein